jgi:hypothetical protein
MSPSWPRASSLAMVAFLALNAPVFASRYVKWVEMSGARVVPVFHYESVANLTNTFNSVNGLLMPGGGSNISTGTEIHSAARVLFDLAVAASSVGDAFPVWGTCMGFQFLHVLAAGSDDVLCQGCFTTEEMALALNFSSAAESSYLLGDLAALQPDLCVVACVAVASRDLQRLQQRAQLGESPLGHFTLDSTHVIWAFN